MRVLQLKLTTSKDPELDLDDPEVNFMSLMKLRGDLSGADFFGAFPGRPGRWCPRNRTTSASAPSASVPRRLEEVAEGHRIYSREVLFYLDPDTGEPQEWSNPFLGGRKVEVDIQRDPVNGVFSRPARTTDATLSLRELRQHGGLPVDFFISTLRP